MFDQWFLEDVRSKLKDNRVLVVIDEQNTCSFLFTLLAKRGYKVLSANTDIDELKVKYQIEKSALDQAHIIRTTTPIEKLSFLREYAETNGAIVIGYLHRYIRDKIADQLPFEIKLSDDQLISAAKLSLEKDRLFWKNISVKGISGIFENFAEMVIDFLCSPQEYTDGMEKNVKKEFLEMLYGSVGKTYIEKPPQTIANEITQSFLENLLKDKMDKFYNNLFKQWRNSKKHFPLLQKLVEEFKLPKDLNIWQVSISHPFRKIDDLWLSELANNINNTDWVNSKAILFRERASNETAREFGISFWEHIAALISFDRKAISKISSLEDAAIFYAKKFSSVDRSIRKLYTEFLNRAEVIRPIQEYYESLLNAYLEKWFEYFDRYKQNQLGLLKKLLSENKGPIAVIVGDGINYEIANGAAELLGIDFSIHTDFIYADFPSETENNMSRLYLEDGSTEPLQAARQEQLTKSLGNDISFVNIDDVTYNSPVERLVIIARDVDSLSEKMQQKALKYFDQIETQLADTIKTLLSAGYRKVFLTSDHGFVLTGDLMEADKVKIADLEKGADVNERFIGVRENQPDEYGTYLQIDKKWKGYNRLIFAKTIKPFKSTGAYGYSHGGVTPQELLTPLFSFGKVKVPSRKLNVVISKKQSLQDIITSTFSLQLSSESGSGEIFSASRKVLLVFLDNKKAFYTSDIITIQENELVTKEFEAPSNPQFEIMLLDAETKESLDTATASRKYIRNINL